MIDSSRIMLDRVQYGNEFDSFKIKDASGAASLSFSVDETKIRTVGIPAVREFLKKLQVCVGIIDHLFCSICENKC